MKRFIIITFVIGFFVMAWMWLRQTARIQMSFLVGETKVLTRGDLTIPIEATGTIEPKDRIEIKSEAGGRVTRTPIEVGDMVKAGELLVELDPEDEQRAVDRAARAVDQAKLNLRQAEASLEQRKQEVPRLEASLASNEAEYELWDWRFERYNELEEGGKRQDEVYSYKSSRDKLAANRDALNAQIAQAKQSVELAALDVEQAKLALKQAETDLADFKERLDETSIVAPSDGMLFDLLVKKGSVIASGSTSFTGGTPLALLADVTELYVRAMVDEADIGRVYDIAPFEARPGNARGSMAEHGSQRLAAQDVPDLVGAPVKITVEAYPEEAFEGIIELIEPGPNRNPGEIVVSYAVRIRLTSPDVGKLFIGMQATVEFLSESIEDEVLVPNEAVRIQAGVRGVYIPVKSQYQPDRMVPKFVPFKAGLDNGMYTQVVDGLSEGDKVYVKLPVDSRGKTVKGDVREP